MNPVQFIWVILALVSFESFQCQKICDLKDTKCTTEAGRHAYQALMSGNSESESIDPLYYAEKIAGNVETLQYELTNATLTGLRNCDIVLLKYDTNELTYNLHLQCPHIVFEYYYEFKGELKGTEVNGGGLGGGILDDYLIIIQGKYALVTSELQQKPHLSSENVKMDTDLKGKLTFITKKVLKGEKGKLDFAVGFLNDNWKAMEKVLRSPTVYEFMLLFIKAYNKYL